MASQNNITKLRRLSNTIQFKSRNSTIDPDRLSQTVKLPALNAIAKSVKHGDLSFTFNRDLNKLRKQPQGPDNLAQSIAHSSLVTIRKRYDNVNKERQQQQLLIQELEIERSKFQIENEKFLQEKAEGQKRVKHLEDELKNIKLKGEQGDTEKKVINNMADRHKSDKIVFDQRKFVMEATLNFLKKQRQLILKENASIKEEEDRTKRVYQKMMEHLESEETERQAHLQSLKNMIMQKQAAAQSSVGRTNQMKQIAENTLSEKDPNQKNWYKVYLCHRFVEKVLRDKMAREMVKFGIVELAFKNIKTATGVNTTEQLTKKFLNKEGNYGDLLGKIADNQKKIAQLKAENDSLTKERNKLKTQKSALSMNKKQEKDLSKEEKQFHNYEEKATNCELFFETMKLWLNRVEKKFITFNNQKGIQTEVSHNSEEVVNHFKMYLQGLLHELSQHPNIQEDKKFDDTVVSKDNNLRVRVWQNSQQLQKAQKNQREVVQFDEDDHVNTIRLDMIRNNEKYMKELHKKYEQIKKQRLDAEPKKKQASPQKPKQPNPSPEAS